MGKTAHPGRNPNVRHHDHPLVTAAAIGALDLAAPDPAVAARQVGAVVALAATETGDPDRADRADRGRAVVAPDLAALGPQVVAPHKNAGSWVGAAAQTVSGATDSSYLKPGLSIERGGEIPALFFFS